MKEKNSHDTRPAKVKSHTPRPTERGGTTGGNVVKPSEIPKTPKPNPQTNPSTTGNTPTPPKPKSEKK